MGIGPGVDCLGSVDVTDVCVWSVDVAVRWYCTEDSLGMDGWMDG